VGSTHEAFPPGEYLKDELEARGWTQTEFAKIIGRPTRVVNEIIATKRGVTPETAIELAAALGTSAQLWLNLESAYQLAIAKPAASVISERAKLREKFPVREMIKRGWITDNDNADRMKMDVLKFYGINNIDDPIVFSHAARRNYDKPFTQLQLAWLFRVRQLADAVPCVSYSKKALQSAIARLEQLTAEPEEMRHVPRILGECGVRFVIVEPFPGSNIDGVCFWIRGDTSPVVGLTLRFDRNDNFWFVLRHELEHVLNEDAKNGLIVDEDVLSLDRDVNDEEKIANAAASDFCVPKKEIEKFIARVSPYFSEQKIVAFSKRIGRHPGLVVGQLQHRLERPEFLNKLKSKSRMYVVSSAFADGWGVSAPL
jgi:HTH-type transcriptional regulator / antitoxin HigA